MAKKEPAAKKKGNPEVTRLVEDAARFLNENRARDGSVETTPRRTEAPNSNEGIMRWWDRLLRRHR
jgi:hypothetical protein